MDLTQTARARRQAERGMSMIVVLAVTVILTAIGIAMVGLMHTDITHASIQHALSRSFYAAQAGLADAAALVASNMTYTTSPDGVLTTYGENSRHTHWVDAVPAGLPRVEPVSCGPGLKTLESLGEVSYLGRMINSRVRACGVPGAPFLVAMFGVSLIEAQGSTSRTYVAPYPVGSPGSPTGGHIGSFTEINFSDTGLRLNALSEQNVDTVALRDGTIEDYRLFGFTTRPVYETNPGRDATPWILAVFGDIIKGQPTSGSIPNDCGTPFACVTVQNSSQDVASIAALRAQENVRRVYMNRMTQQVLPRLCADQPRATFCDPDAFQDRALGNAENQNLNTAAGIANKPDSAYSPSQFDRIVNYLAANCPTQCLRGPVYISDDYTFTRSVNLGGDAGTVTLGVRGDLVLGTNVSLTNRHDLTTVEGRETPGIIVYGKETPTSRLSNVCAGERANGSGRLILCGGSNQRLTVDGLLYTEDGIAIGAQATVDQIGAMYHNNRRTSNPSLSNNNATVVLRFDPLSLRGVGSGIAILSWQQVK